MPQKPVPKKPAQDHRLDANGPFTLSPIAVARTPYQERYGIPNQAATLRGTRDGVAAEGRIELLPHIPDAALSNFEGFDYAWVIFVFHLNRGWGPKVRPPRAPHLEVGVLSTRAPHRPNPLGLSALKIERAEPRALVVRGIDLVDGTPILDIKPYIPYADAFPEARAGWVDEVVPEGPKERERTGDWTPGEEAGAGAAEPAD